MNAQYPITTTPTYNFSQIPQQILEISLRTLKKLPKQSPNPPPTTNLTNLRPNQTSTTIIAIDVSSINLGETQTGALIATRGAIVWKQNRQYHYLRLGPFPFHLTQRNHGEIRSLLNNNYQSTQIQEYTFLSPINVQTRLTAVLERWIQSFASQTTHNSIILWDGSLTAGTPETSVQNMEKMLKEARNRCNTILAFSKATKLFSCGNRITELASEYSPPFLLKIKEHPSLGGSMRLLGNVYVTKLSNGFAFRLDVDKEFSDEQVVDAVQRLLGNDLVPHGYPETLRLAHIYSTFTANEVIGLQRCVTKEGNMKIVARANLRRLLFGPFGKGPEG